MASYCARSAVSHNKDSPAFQNIFANIICNGSNFTFRFYGVSNFYDLFKITHTDILVSTLCLCLRLPNLQLNTNSLINESVSLKALLYDFTLIIPTKNRPQFILRILEYYNYTSENLKIIVADSSSSDIYSINSKIIKNSKLKVLHLHLPKFFPDNAIYMSLKYVTTNFCAVIADDDVILSNAIQEGISLLKKDLSLIAVIGDICYFGIFSQKRDPTKGKLRSYQRIKSKSYMFNSPKLRIRKFFKGPNFEPLAFSLARTDKLKVSYEYAATLNSAQSWIFGEFLQAVNLLKLGKVQRLRNTFVIRQSHSNNRFHQNTILEWLALPSYFECLVKLCHEINDSQTWKYICLHINNYLASNFSHKKSFLKLFQAKIRTKIPIQFVRSKYSLCKLESDSEKIYLSKFIKI